MNMRRKAHLWWEASKDLGYVISWPVRFLWWLMWRPTALVIYLLAIPVVGIWLAWHSLDVRFTAIETALGGPVKMRCNRYQAIKDVSHSVVRIIGGKGEGSGFMVGDGLILTNHHVIADEPSPKIVYWDGTFETGNVFATHAGSDLAIITVSKHLPQLSWADGESVPTGEPVLTFGFPLGGQLDGAVTVNDTTVSGDRVNSNGGDPVYYVQLAGGSIEGMSGGPVVDLCGKVVGVNDLGTAGALSLAIDKVTAKNFIFNATDQPEYFRGGIAKIEFNPDASPEELVRAYYNYLKVRNFQEAYNLLSPNFIGNVDYETWVKGFAYELDTTVNDIQIDKRYPMRVKVWLTSTDYENGIFYYKSFEGAWLVRKIDGHLKLWESNIKETTND